MSDNNSIKMALIVLAGVVLTVTVAVLGSVYNHHKNIERDKFLIEQCTGVAYKYQQNFGRGATSPTYKVKCDDGVQEPQQ